MAVPAESVDGSDALSLRVTKRYVAPPSVGVAKLSSHQRRLVEPDEAVAGGLDAARPRHSTSATTMANGGAERRGHAVIVRTYQRA